MKKYVFTIMTATALSIPATTAEAEPLYLSLSGGMGFTNNSTVEVDSNSSVTTKWNDAVKYKSGYAIEGAVGTREGMLRGEIAVGYQSSDVDQIFGSDIDAIENAANDALKDWGVTDSVDDLKITASAVTLMYNLYGDFDLKGPITPYLMGGLGAAFVDMEVSFNDNGAKVESSYDKTVFAWQLGAGFGIAVTDKIDIDLGYRYFNTSNIDLGSDAKLSYGSSKVLVGMRYNF